MNIPMIKVQLRNNRINSNDIEEWNTIEDTKMLQMQTNNVIISTDNASCHTRQGDTFFCKGCMANPYKQQQPNVTAPNINDTKNLFPLYSLNPNGCSK